MNFFSKKNKKNDAPLSREQSLKAIPIYNEGIKEKEENGKLQISYLREAPMFSKLVNRLGLPKPEKTIIFDPLGEYIWRKIDGKLTTDQIIEDFRIKYKLSRREAEVSVVQHLKNLMERGAISLVFK